MNLAIKDVCMLAGALAAHYSTNSELELRNYSANCLRNAWRAQHFSWWMTAMLHRHDLNDPYEHKLQLAQLEYVCSSEAAMRTLAENYVGYEF